MIDRQHPLTVVAQCKLLGLSRARVYRCSLPRQVDNEGGEFSACCLNILGGNFPSALWGRSSL